MTSEVANGGSLDIERLGRDVAREYVRSIYLWRSVDMIGAMASSVPFKVTKANEESQLTRDELDVPRLLVRPNPQWTGPALQYFIATSIVVANCAFLKIARGVGRSVQELWPLSPNEVTSVYYANSRMIEYFQLNGPDGRLQRIYVDPRDRR